MVTKMLIPKQMLDNSNSSDDSMSDFQSPSSGGLSSTGRKRKLDHLTWEEKIQRKKLKNRVAAQTSRDRKKKQVEEMQVTIELQQDQIASLEDKCAEMQSERDEIMTKYEKLEKDYLKLKLRMDKQEEKTQNHHNIPEEHKYTRTMVVDSGCSIGSGTIKSEGSAVSDKPLLKVKIEPKSTEQTVNDSTEALLKIIVLCLLYRNSSMISIFPNWKNLQKAYSQMSHHQWKMMIQNASKNMPKMLARNSNCLNQWWGPASQEWNPPKISVAQ